MSTGLVSFSICSGWGTIKGDTSAVSIRRITTPSDNRVNLFLPNRCKDSLTSLILGLIDFIIPRLLVMLHTSLYPDSRVQSNNDVRYQV